MFCISTRPFLFQHCPTITINTTQKSLSGCDRRVLHVNDSRRHPYMIPVGRLRRYSTSSSSTCSSSSSSSSSEYSQPSPSYSITSYESSSPEPLISPYATTDCQSPHLVPLGPAIPITTTASTTYRSPEREAQVFERLRQLVPMLPFDRSAYQVRYEFSCVVLHPKRMTHYVNIEGVSESGSGNHLGKLMLALMYYYDFVSVLALQRCNHYCT